MADRSDNFNRGAGGLTVAAPSDGGSNWVIHSGNFRVESDETVSNYGSSANASATLEAGASDVDVLITMAVAGNHWNTGLIARLIDSSNYLFVTGNGGTYAIHKRVGGTNTAVASGISTVAVGDRIRLRCVGTQISLYRTPSAGSESLVSGPHTVGDHATATKHGLYGNFSTAKLDDFAIIDLGGGGGGLSIPVVMHHRRMMGMS